MAGAGVCAPGPSCGSGGGGSVSAAVTRGGYTQLHRSGASSGRTVTVPVRRASCDQDSRPARRAVVTRSWYAGYGALAEEPEDTADDPGGGGGGGSLTDVGRCGGRRSGIDLVMPSLKSLVSMATLSRRRSSSTTALNSSRGEPARLPSSAKSVTALPLLRDPPPPPLRPVNRLRVSSAKMCSRCSSILSMASSSRYSINTAGFVPVSDCRDGGSSVMCKLCLVDVPSNLTWTLQHCSCTFCIECMQAYVEFEVNEGAYEISCPDALCERQGVVSMGEVGRLLSEDSYEKHKRFRLNREVELDKSRTWCPRAGCETVCTVCTGPERCLPQSVHCPTCDTDFCSNCRTSWHAGVPCRPEDLAQPIPGITFDSELIKCCPMCAVPIEKDEGCAQMMCKRCKHVFCWYCLASLDDDFLLRHYDKGPCKNKLGHSRASVIWHRTQVIGIFAGFGILLLVASPLLLLAAPCIVCCKCRVCSSGGKLDPDDEIPEEGGT